MKKIILILISIFFLSSCERPRIYIYEYHWKESKFSNWNSYNFYVDDVLSDGGSRFKFEGFVEPEMSADGGSFTVEFEVAEEPRRRR